MSSTSIKVLVADDQRLVRDGIASILSLFEDIEVCAVASDGGESVEKARTSKPDVALLDIRMPVLDGIAAAETMLREKTAGAALMLTTFDDEEYIVKAVRAGASGYLLKDLPSEELHQAITTVHKGGFLSTQAIMGKVQNHIQTSDSSDAQALRLYAPLSRREKDILKLVGEGATNQEIAAELGLSEGTVKNYISGILDNMGFRDRIQAALFASRNGLS
ncbi:MAG: response regulator transcription factor [Spirochaetales bacterium]|nr:response regulator transcription factor [Spirochaetales bacterium]MCF7939098.1 response regulator transcription factor [Spirochaetales bacterium]